MKDEEKYLEDEMEKFGERWPYPASFDGYDKDWVDELTEECAKHFYELGKTKQKEQMMSKAVEGTITAAVGALGYNIAAFRFDDNHKYTILLPHKEGRKYGDRVRIIIVEED